MHTKRRVFLIVLVPARQGTVAIRRKEQALQPAVVSSVHRVVGSIACSSLRCSQENNNGSWTPFSQKQSRECSEFVRLERFWFVPAARNCFLMTAAVGVERRKRSAAIFVDLPRHCVPSQRARPRGRNEDTSPLCNPASTWNPVRLGGGGANRAKGILRSVSCSVHCFAVGILTGLLVTYQAFLSISLEVSLYPLRLSVSVSQHDQCRWN